MMAGIRGGNTKPEMILRRALHALGLRYRLHDRSLPGKPDLVFRSRGAVIFVNGCFWHGHDCHLFRWPGSRADFWRAKISGNIIRDRKVRENLSTSGWRVLDIWECTLKGRKRWLLSDVIDQAVAFLGGNAANASIGSPATVPLENEEGTGEETGDPVT